MSSKIQVSQSLESVLFPTFLLHGRSRALIERREQTLPTHRCHYNNYGENCLFFLSSIDEDSNNNNNKATLFLSRFLFYFEKNMKSHADDALIEINPLQCDTSLPLEEIMTLERPVGVSHGQVK